MPDEYAAESKFLLKNYKVFLKQYLEEFKVGNEPLHLHPPPAFKALYRRIMDVYISDEEELKTSDLITMMDMVAKFMVHLHKQGIDYNNFTPCSCCMRLTDSDLALLLSIESGGENQ